MENSSIEAFVIPIRCSTVRPRRIFESTNFEKKKKRKRFTNSSRLYYGTLNIIKLRIKLSFRIVSRFEDIFR